MKKVKNLVFLFLISIILLSSFNVSNAGVMKTVISRLKNKIKSNATTIINDNTSNKESIKKITSIIAKIRQNNNSEVKKDDPVLLPNNKITVQEVNKYVFQAGESGCQGSCTDGKYVYIALISKDNNPYINQKTTMLIIDLNTKEIVKRVSLGKIGHSNALTYNPHKKTIIISTCSTYKKYIYSVSTDSLLNSDKPDLTKIYLKNKDNERMTNVKSISTVCYDVETKEYCILWGQKRVAIFDESFKLKNTIDLNEEVYSGGINTGQSIYCDSSYIYFIGNYITEGDLSKTINYIKIYNYDGKLIRRAKINGTGAEFESMFADKENYYIVGNAVEKINERNNYFVKIYKFNIK